MSSPTAPAVARPATAATEARLVVTVLLGWDFTTDGGPLYSWNLIILALDAVFGLGFLERDLLLLVWLLLDDDEEEEEEEEEDAPPALVPWKLVESLSPDEEGEDEEDEDDVDKAFAAAKIDVGDTIDTACCWVPALLPPNATGIEMLLANVNEMGKGPRSGLAEVGGLLMSERLDESSMEGEGAPSLPALSSSTV